MKTLFAGLLIVTSATAQPAAMATSTAVSVLRTMSYAPAGLAVGETLQVNLTNLATASKSGTAASCTATVTFYNAAGTAIGTATSLTVASGQIVSAKLPYASAGASGSRALIRSVVQVTSASGSAPCSLATSMETYDAATGITHTNQSEPTDVVQPFSVFGRN